MEATRKARRAALGGVLSLSLLGACTLEPTAATVMGQRWVRWGEADVLLAGGTDGMGGGDGPVLVYLHGFASTPEDQLSLRGGLAVPPGTRFVFPRGPVRADGAWAWWALDRQLRGRLRAEPFGMRELAGHRPAGMRRARSALERVLSSVETRMGAPPERTVLAGFSQGAMLSCDTFLRGSRRFAGVACMSGTMLTQPEWIEAMATHAGERVFISHGRHDPLLPFAMSERLAAELTTHSLDVTWAPYPGGHSMTDPLARRFASFVAESFRATP
ncbi:MAG: alpha/beta hydrolase [Sandaracinaceae bacterium]